MRGEPGAGKTTLLAHIANHERTRQRFRRIWWIDQPDRLDQTLALALNLPHVLAEPDPAARRLKLAAHLDDHTLLIVDNLTPGDPLNETITILTPQRADRGGDAPALPDPDQPCPKTPKASSRCAAWTIPPRWIRSRAMPGSRIPAGFAPDLLRIATTLGHHPYALMLAGVLIRRDGLSLDEFETAGSDPSRQKMCGSHCRTGRNSDTSPAEAEPTLRPQNASLESRAGRVGRGAAARLPAVVRCVRRFPAGGRAV